MLGRYCRRGGAAAPCPHHRHAIELVMVEQDRKVVGDICPPSPRQPSRSAITWPVRHQVAHPEVALDGRIRVPGEPRARRALQPQNRDSARFSPPAPRQGTAAPSLDLTVFVHHAVVSHAHGHSLDPSTTPNLAPYSPPGAAAAPPGRPPHN